MEKHTGGNMQQFTSKGTSINSKKVPALFTKVDKHFGWIKDTTNLDFGGGKFETATKFLERKLVTNLILDPFNRTFYHNANVLVQMAMLGGVHTVTVSNVLNTIKERDERLAIIESAYRQLKDTGTLYITCYNSGKAGESNPGDYQVAKPLKSYVPLVKSIFNIVKIKYSMIIATK